MVRCIKQACAALQLKIWRQKGQPVPAASLAPPPPPVLGSGFPVAKPGDAGQRSPPPEPSLPLSMACFANLSPANIQARQSHPDLTPEKQRLSYLMLNPFLEIRFRCNLGEKFQMLSLLLLPGAGMQMRGASARQLGPPLHPSCPSRALPPQLRCVLMHINCYFLHLWEI